MPERTKGSQQAEDAQDAEDARTLRFRQHDEGDVDERDEHQEAVHDVPAAVQVGVLADQQPLRQHLRTTPARSACM